jgi:hypothetical protein
MRSTSLFVLLATALACALFAAPAQAQRDRVFVASYGSDANPCTFGSPCKTFQNAFGVVAAGGEITAIDSAGFGPVSIDKAVTITSPNGVEAGIAALSGGSAVSIAAGQNDVIVLSGLTLEGAGTGSAGIALNGGGNLEVINCAIRNYTTAGIYVIPSGPTATTLLVSNTTVSDISEGGVGGIVITSASGTIQAALDHVTINNSGVGLYASAETQPIEVQVANSHIDNNIVMGVSMLGFSSSFVSNVIMRDVTLNQTPTAIALQGNSNLWLSEVTQQSSTAGGTTSIAFSGTNNTANSDQTNHLMGTMTGSGSLTTWSNQ